MKFINFIVVLLLLSCSSEHSPVPSSQQDNNTNDDDNSAIINILFIGNSLTIANGGIETHVQNFYNEGNPEVIAYTQSASISGASLKEHLMAGLAEGAINSKEWDYIILQENGIVATINPEETLASILDFKELISSSANVFLFMTWAYEEQPEMTEQLTSVYYEAASLTNYSVIPVGLGWRDFEAENNSISLLGSDGLHPSNYGTYFASAMIFNIISNQQVGQIPYNANLTSAEANYIKQAVSEAIATYY